MKTKRPLLLFLLIMGFLLFLGLLFQQFFLANLILPVATVIWLLLRIFVLSIDQQVYWWSLISLVVFFAIFRVFLGPETIEQPYQPPGSNQTLDSVDHWRTSILSNVHETGENNTLKRELMWLLTSMVSPRQKGCAHFEIKEALEQHQIPLPEHVYAFLFSNEPEESRQTFFHNPVRYFKQLFRSIRRTTQKKIRRWTGREAAEYYQAIDEVLTLMENTLEIKYDNDPNGSRND